MNFAEAMRNESTHTRTENGAFALNTTGCKLLDFYSTVGALRNADDSRITRLFADAFNEDALLATKATFYGRDVRGGLGERATFRTIIRYMANYHQEAILPNLDLIGVYGRDDDMYALIGTSVEDAMWAAMKAQFDEDRANLAEGKAVSMLAKWMKTADASSPKTRKLGILTAQKMGMSVYDYKRAVRALRKHIGVIESLMSTGKWDEIKYSAVPSRAMMIYRDAFMRHDGERFDSFINKAVKGETKINSSTLYPYDLIEKAMSKRWHASEDKTVEAQWRQLPNYVEEGTNAIVIADTSGSMMCDNGRPLYTAVGLALYFAERNKGAYHNMWMNFSERPTIQTVKGETLAQKINNMNMDNWGNSTNCKAALQKILDIAIENHVSADEMPKAIVIISDMEFNRHGSDRWTFYETVRKLYKTHGYEIPNIIFWNVHSKNDVFHADTKHKGVQLVSGASASTFKNVMACIGMTPTEAMLKVLNSERYDAVKVI